jgi:hypothetical protein
MNYIDLINRFWQKDMELNFTDRETALYFYLLKVCNSISWKNPFGLSNAMTIAKFGWGKSSFDTAKKRLQEAGLIKFKPGDGRGNIYRYEIVDCGDSEKVNKKGDEIIPLSDTLSDTLSSLKPETSLNININKNINSLESSYEDSFSGDTPPDPPFSPPSRESNVPSPERIDYRKFVDWFNETTKGVFGKPRYPLGRQCTASIRARIREHGKEALIEVVKKAFASDFLKGNNKIEFRATLHWMLRPSNFNKILSGNYDNRKKTAGSGGRTTIEELDAAVEIGFALAENSKKTGDR